MGGDLGLGDVVGAYLLAYVALQLGHGLLWITVGYGLARLVIAILRRTLR